MADSGTLLPFGPIAAKDRFPPILIVQCSASNDRFGSWLRQNVVRLLTTPRRENSRLRK